MDCIKNIDDVKRFFRYLYDERKVAFHPDETFDGYVSWGEDTPTKAMAGIYSATSRHAVWLFA